MTQGSRPRALAALYYLLALLGTIGTQVQLPAYLPYGFVLGTVTFWTDTLANPASVFLLVDIFVLASAVFIWMFGEARRIQMRFIWLYIFGSLFIGVSIFVPLFLAQRERRLQALAQGDDRPAGLDWLGVAFGLSLCLLVTVYSVWRALP